MSDLAPEQTNGHVAPAQTAVEAPVVQQTQAAPVQQVAQAAPTSLRDAFKANGYDLGDIDDRAILEQVTGAVRFKQQYEPLIPQWQQQAAQTQKPAEAAQTVEPDASPKYKPIEVPHDALKYVRVNDETGQLEPVDPRFPNIAAINAVREYQAQVEEREIALKTDPVGSLMEWGLKDQLTSLREELKAEVLKEIQTQQQTSTSEAEMQQFMATHGPELYVLDGTGQPQVNFFTGEYQLSDKGAAYQQAIGEAQQFGIQGESNIHRYAWNQVQRQFPAQQQAAPVQQQQINPNEQAKNNYVQRGRQAASNGVNRIVNRAASISTAAQLREAQNPSLDLRQMAIEDFAANGIQLNRQ